MSGSKRWEHIQEVFLAAREREPEERRSFLADECGDDDALRGEVESLLEADTGAGNVDRMADDWLADWDAAAGPTLVGADVGPYRVRSVLGSGGMGTVYLAERADEQFRQVVALKILRAEAGSRELHRRFLRERQILARLTHPGIARLYDGGMTDDGRPWFAMEYVPGRPLHLHCEEDELPVDARVELVIRACEAVEHAHRNLVVHRDLKPSNILVTDDGGVHLLDFGIAKLLDPETGDGTRTALRAMTPDYASPEQVRGEPVTTASDVYSLGVVLYEALSGRRPYSVGGLSPSEVEAVVCGQDPPAPSTAADGERRRRALAGDLDTIAAKAMRKEPDRRYGSVSALRDDLQRWRRGLPVLARPDTAGYRLRKFVRRNRWAVTASGAVALALLAGVAGTTWQARRAAAQAVTAAEERDRARRVTDVLVEMFEGADPYAAGSDNVSARAILDRGRESLHELDDDPRLRSTVLMSMGKAYQNLALYDEAESLITESLVLRRRIAGTDEDVDVAESISGLGVLDLNRDRIEDSVPRLRRALAIRRDLLGEHHPDVASSWNNLGNALHHLGRIDSAIVCYQRSVDLWREDPAKSDADVAVALGNLGVAMGHAQRLDEAEAMLREAIEINRRELGDDHPFTATVINNLAGVHIARDEIDEAGVLYREARDIRARALGPEHPAVGQIENNLGYVMKRQGNLEEAERLYRHALKVKRAQLGEDSPSVARSASNLAMLLLEMERLDEAESEIREALAIVQRAWEGEHTDIARDLINLGTVRAARGDTTAAVDLVREGTRMRHALLGADHPHTVKADSILASLTGDAR